ncbi:MAG: glycosyltransferase [Candidatus Electrothrix sp. AX5]|nr:glycosyltransferase [Candidatus Electrothrix sp. AX5]
MKGDSMRKVYNPLHYDQATTVNHLVFWKKISKPFFQAMNKELTFDMITKKINIVRKLRRLKSSSQPITTTSSKAVEKSITLLGVHVDLLTENRLNQYISSVIERKSKKMVLNVNVHCYNMVFKNPKLRKILNTAGVVFCDGFGVALGAKISGLCMPTRFTPADSIWSLAKLAEKKGHSFYFLGAEDGIAEKAAQNMKARYPNLKITTHHGYFDKSYNSDENNKIVKKINASKANILVVGFGMPIQEEWLEENWNDLNVNIGFSAGALFDYVSGELRRGPRWMTDNGLEWLARMLIEPKRLWRRYFIGNTVFLYKVIAERLEDIAKEAIVIGQEMLTQSIAMWTEMFIIPAVREDNRQTKIITTGYSATRKSPRTKLKGYSAEIVKNGVRYQASIKDVSPEGIQLVNIPSLLASEKGGHLNISVSNLLGSTEYQLTVKTEWKKKAGRRLVAAGFSILNAPNEWKMLMPQMATN